MQNQAKMIAAIVGEYQSLMARLEAADTHEKAAQAEESLEYFLTKYPNPWHYDDQGNYVGPVSNENGWTP